MGTLQYVGKRVTEDPDVVYKDYVGLVKNADMTVTQIDDAINGGLAGYATVGYVKGQDAKNATQGYVDGQPPGTNPNGGDAARLPLSQKSIGNGSCPLDATGRIPSSRIIAPLTQKWVRGPWTPPSYFTVPQPITTEATLYSCPVQDPGYVYRLVVFGHLDVRSSMHAEYGNFYVREGSATGQIVAAGVGPAASSETVVPTSGESFGTAFADGVGPNWDAFMKEGDGSSFYKVAGGEAVWNDVGHQISEWRYRRLGPDALTLTDYQRVRMIIGTVKGDKPLVGGQPQRTRVCARMSTNQNDWVGFELTHNELTMQYSLAGNIVAMGGAGWTVTPGAVISTAPDVGTSYDILAGTVNNLRQFLFYRNNAFVGGAVDGNNVTAADSGHRGWGFHGRATSQTGLVQMKPPNIADLLITDAAPSAYHVSLIPANIAATTPRQGSTTLYVRGVRSGALSTQNVLPYKPKLTIFALPV